MSSAAQVSLQDQFAGSGGLPERRELPQKRQVTGIHLGHNAAAALVEDGKLIFAMQEERLSRVKNQGGLPVLTLDYIGGLAGGHGGGDGKRDVALGGKKLSLCYLRRWGLLRDARDRGP